jgi:ParB-like nuclease family protein
VEPIIGPYDEETMNRALEQYPVGWLDVPLRQIVKAEWNYKNEDQELGEKLTNQIAHNGQLENVIVRMIEVHPNGSPSGVTFEMVNGNHRYDSFEELDMPVIHVYNLGFVELDVAQRIAIETNETRFSTNPDRFLKIVQSLLNRYSVDVLSQTMPMNEAALRNIQALQQSYQRPPVEENLGPIPSRQHHVSFVLQQESYDLWLEWRNANTEPGQTDTVAFLKLLSLGIVREGIEE